MHSKNRDIASEFNTMPSNLNAHMNTAKQHSHLHVHKHTCINISAHTHTHIHGSHTHKHRGICNKMGLTVAEANPVCLVVVVFFF